MTQFKDKATKLGFRTSDDASDEIKFTHEGARPQASINAGLLCYPRPDGCRYFIVQR